MSYSRWINSDFYTYWCSSKVYDYTDELFALHASLDQTHLFTYAECKEFFKDGSKLTERVTDVRLTYDDVQEIFGYMQEFIYDVDLEYSQQLSKLRGGQ